MIWRNPWAWLGLLTIAVPVLIHLLTRRTARVQRFPTLRFLGESAQIAARRLRLHDPLLLAVRILILVMATAALAQPYFDRPDRQSRGARTITRAIVVDTSASMQRATPAGRGAIEVARDSARTLAEAGAHTIVETTAPSQALAGAAAWLNTQPGAREVVVISDFQLGAVVEADVAALPADIGVQWKRIEVAPGVNQATTAVTRASIGNTVRVLAQTNAAVRAQATLNAAIAAGAPIKDDTTRRVAIVFPGFDAGNTQPVDRPWMGDLVARLPADSLLLRAARGTIDGSEQLLLFTRAEPGTLPGARFVSAVLDAYDTAPSGAERDPDVLADTTLARWSREASEAKRAALPDVSDGRWFWLLALLLIGVESWLRRKQPHAHAA